MTIYNIYSLFIYYCLYCLYHNLFPYIVAVTLCENIPTCEHLPVGGGGITLCFLAFTFKYLYCRHIFYWLINLMK